MFLYPKFILTLLSSNRLCLSILDPLILFSNDPGNTGKRKINIHQKSDRNGKEHKIETSLPTRAGNLPHRRSKDNGPPYPTQQPQRICSNH